MEPDEPGKEGKGAMDDLERAGLGEEAAGHGGAFFADWQGHDLRLPKEALEALRQIEKTKLIIESIEASQGGFADLAVNSLMLVGDLASDAIRRVEKFEGRGKASPQK